MDLQLANKSVLVSGSTAGIGFAIAALFAEEGATVILNGRTQGRVKEEIAAMVVYISSRAPLARTERLSASKGEWCGRFNEAELNNRRRHAFGSRPSASIARSVDSLVSSSEQAC